MTGKGQFGIKDGGITLGLKFENLKEAGRSRSMGTRMCSCSWLFGRPSASTLVATIHLFTVV